MDLVAAALLYSNFVMLRSTLGRPAPPVTLGGAAGGMGGVGPPGVWGGGAAGGMGGWGRRGYGGGGAAGVWGVGKTTNPRSSK